MSLLQELMNLLSEDAHTFGPLVHQYEQKEVARRASMMPTHTGLPDEEGGEFAELAEIVV